MVTPIFSEKVPPHSLESELAILGSMILSPIGRATAIQGLEPTDFYADKNALLFKVMREMDEKGFVDLLTLSERLRVMGELENVGGMTYLMSCVNSCVFMDTPDSYVKLIKDASQRRKLIRSLKESLYVAEDELVPMDEAQSTSEAKVLGVREPPKEEVDPVEWAESVEIESVMVESGSEGRRRIKTGLHHVDENVKLWPKRLSVIAGGTSQGKTAFVLAVTTNSALSLQQRTYVWSGEMEKPELWERMCAAQLNIRYEHIQDRRLSQKERDEIKGFAAKVKQAPLIIRDDAKTVSDIRADCRYIAHTQGPIDLVIIDYLALLKDLNIETEGQDRRDVRIGIIVWNLIQMAKELDCHVILLHQLNRDKDKRANSRPRVSDLKDSSTIEQHAHNVLLVYRPERDESIPPDEVKQYEHAMEFIIGKQRGGKVGSVWLTFNGDKQQIFTMQKERWPKPVSVNDKRRG